MEDINIGKDTVIGTVITKGVIEDDINPGKFTQEEEAILRLCLLYTSPSPRDA